MCFYSSYMQSTYKAYYLKLHVCLQSNNNNLYIYMWIIQSTISSYLDVNYHFMIDKYAHQILGAQKLITIYIGIFCHLDNKYLKIEITKKPPRNPIYPQLLRHPISLLKNSLYYIFYPLTMTIVAIHFLRFSYTHDESQNIIIFYVNTLDLINYQNHILSIRS